MTDRFTIQHPIGFTATGQRENNEDSIYPDLNAATDQDQLFMVCDGVGGALKGELASQTTVASFAEFVKQHPESVPTDLYWQAALKYVEQKFDLLFKEQFLLKGMGTTLTLLSLSDAGITIAHIGDSRVYQIREGTIIFQTSDHSLVSELVRAGSITPDEAATHPQKNVITRAIQGSYDPALLDITHVEDVWPGDYFFLCSDGVVESVSDKQLASFLHGNSVSNEEKVSYILDLCATTSHDNYSGYLIQINEYERLEGAATKQVNVHETTPL